MTDGANSLNRILIAEDDPISRRLLQAFLTKWGYQVEVAVDGSEAVAKLEQPGAPQLAVLDWMMPGLEGPEVCRRVRQIADRPYTYILLLTARGQKDDLLRGLEAGADDYLTKPFDSQELRARLNVGERILDLQRNLIQAREELRFRACHDVLTGLANRGSVLDMANREYSRQSREGGSFGLIIIDLDHFKSVNDTHGHLCGDEVLHEAARRLLASVRNYDTVGRYGGEEFLVIAPATDGPGTLALAERIRQAIDDPAIPTEAGPVHITASCGAAVSDCEHALKPDDLLRIADEALYRAKGRGRNCSELAGPPQAASAATNVEERVAKLSVTRRTFGG
ncbi:MAG TPA: diguanylate cyclase [Candidatus Dormibacteraeota bacterium]|nr:diguanylate cyclase [Candidatus Dormibacteraeota bacterium]